MDSHYRYWGKADKEISPQPGFHLLCYHGLDVAATGLHLLESDKLLSRNLEEVSGLDSIALKSIIPFFLSIHDIGKFSGRFQALRPDIYMLLQKKESLKPYSVSHGNLGYMLWQKRVYESLSKAGSLPDDYNGLFSIWKYLSDALAPPAIGHHGYPPEAHRDIMVEDHFSDEDILAATEFCKRMLSLHVRRDIHLPSDPKKALKKKLKRASWLFAGLVILCDWIGSNTGFFPHVSGVIPLEEYWRETALAQARHALLKSGVLPSPISPAGGAGKIFPTLASLRPMQAHVDNCAIASTAQLFILEDMTGSGKTEAAITLAHRLMAQGLASGVYVALPTMATANAMYERMAKAYRRLYSGDGNPSLVLAHGSSHLMSDFNNSILPMDMSTQTYGSMEDETASAQCSAWIADSRKKALLAHIGVGTIDQALVSILPSRHQSLRLLGLSGKVLIVDEVHACDDYMNGLLKTLLAFHRAQGGSAILLSATLPQTTRSELERIYCDEDAGDPPTADGMGYPLFTHVSAKACHRTTVKAGDETRILIKARLISDSDQVMALALEVVKKGKCVCWIRNTVADAMETYDKFEPILGAENARLFHARYAMGHRLEIEEEIRRLFGVKSGHLERAGKILVATQVVEQSLDLDFDLMISDLAPVDSLIQRAGRLCRHTRDKQGNPISSGKDCRGTPQLIVFSPPPTDTPDSGWYKNMFPKAAYVYPHHGQLWLTARLIHQKGGWKMPEDARLLIEGVYGPDAKSPPGMQASANQADGARFSDRSYARLNSLKLDQGYRATPAQWLDDTKAPTRLGDMSVTLQLAVWDGASLLPIAENAKQHKEHSQVSVNARKISGEAEPGDPALGRAMKDMKERMGGKGRWVVQVPMTPTVGNAWVGEAKDRDGNTVIVEYTKSRGLQVLNKSRSE
ncbi:MAG: CRISPR-associated helicase Cas3' [Nitrospinota bacterium]|nr:CRISPR-associated helicase Cas3' [Nitrospinota bacterium]